MFNLRNIKEKLSNKKKLSKGNNLPTDENQQGAKFNNGLILSLKTKSNKYNIGKNSAKNLKLNYVSSKKKGKTSYRYYKQIDLPVLQEMPRTGNIKKRKEAPDMATGTVNESEVITSTDNHNNNSAKNSIKLGGRKRKFLKNPIKLGRKKRKLSKEVSSEINNDACILNSNMDIENEIIDKINKSNIISKTYIDTLVTSDDTMLIALYPKTKIDFNGNIWLRQILGKCVILGYEFKEKSCHPILSSTIHNLMYIYASEGKKVKQFNMVEMNELDISEKWIRNLPVDENDEVTIVEVRRYVSRSVSIMKKLDSLKVTWPLPVKDKLWYDVLGAYVVENKHSNTLKESENWNNFVNKLRIPVCPSERQPCVVITGGIGVGKSTFLRYVVNSLLNQTNEVACIDLDPGQPEFSLPSCVTLSIIDQPLLGPSSLHFDHKKFKWQKQEFLGETSVNDCLDDYMDMTIRLVTEAVSKNVPIVVNTMGYTSGIGFDIMVDLLRIINPSHVVTLESRNSKKNFDHTLELYAISISDVGITQKPRSLNYELTTMPAYSADESQYTNKDMKNLRIMSFTSSLWPEGETNFESNTLMKPIVIPWSAAALYDMNCLTQGDKPEMALKCYEWSLVALCSVDKKLLEKNNAGSLVLRKDCNWFGSHKFIQWGIICQIDCDTKKIHILTPLEENIFLSEVNLIIKTFTPQLPIEYAEVFNFRDARVPLDKFHLSCWDEWKSIYANISTDSLDNWLKAFKQIEIWTEREVRLPDEITTTSHLLACLTTTSTEKSTDTLKVLLSYRQTIQEFHNNVKNFGISDRKYSLSNKILAQNYAKSSGFLRYITRKRNSTAHRQNHLNRTPRALLCLRNDVLNCLRWIKTNYWDKIIGVVEPNPVTQKLNDDREAENTRTFMNYYDLLVDYTLSSLVDSRSDLKEVYIKIAELFADSCKIDMTNAVKQLVSKLFCSCQMAEFCQSIEDSHQCCDIRIPADILRPIVGIMRAIDEQHALKAVLHQLVELTDDKEIALLWIRILFVSHFPSRSKVCVKHRFFVTNKPNLDSQKTMWKKVMVDLGLVAKRPQFDLAMIIAEGIDMSQEAKQNLRSLFKTYSRSLVPLSDDGEENSEDEEISEQIMNAKIFSLDDLLIDAKKIDVRTHLAVQEELKLYRPQLDQENESTVS